MAVNGMTLCTCPPTAPPFACLRVCVFLRRARFCRHRVQKLNRVSLLPDAAGQKGLSSSNLCCTCVRSRGRNGGRSCGCVGSSLRDRRTTRPPEEMLLFAIGACRRGIHRSPLCPGRCHLGHSCFSHLVGSRFSPVCQGGQAPPLYSQMSGMDGFSSCVYSRWFLPDINSREGLDTDRDGDISVSGRGRGMGALPL